MTTITPITKGLDVLLLLDDPTEFGGRTDGYETFLAVSEVIDVMEPALLRLGHRARRLSFEMSVPALVARLAVEPPDVVFQLGQPIPTDPASEAQVTALLDLLGIATTSESLETLVLARDKARAKALFSNAGIPSPAYAVSPDGLLPKALPPSPWIAKPTLEDGSVGIGADAVASDRMLLAERVRTLYERFDEPILIETFVTGREFHVGVVGGELLPIAETDFSELPADRPPMISYDTKWKYDSLEWKRVHHICPAVVTDEIAARIRNVARQTIAAFGIQRCSRLDMRMDDQGGLYVLDVNPNPDLSPLAVMYAMADVAGWGFDGLVQRLLDLARGGRIKGR